MIKKITLLAVAAGLFHATPALCQTPVWKASEVRGQATATLGSKSGTLRAGTALESGTLVETGADGRVVLVRGGEFITIAQNSRIRLAPPEGDGGIIQVLQDWGNAIFRIEKKAKPHFGVGTPYLAAVVKGTTFSITVDAQGSSMQVIEGAVEVSTDDGGARSLIRPGSVASVDARDLYQITVSGDQNLIVNSPARPAGSASAPTSATVPSPLGQLLVESIAAAPVELASLTNNLVSNEATGTAAQLGKGSKSDKSTSQGGSQFTRVWDGAIDSRNGNANDDKFRGNNGQGGNGNGQGGTSNGGTGNGNGGAGNGNGGGGNGNGGAGNGNGGAGNGNGGAGNGNGGAGNGNGKGPK